MKKIDSRITCAAGFCLLLIAGWWASEQYKAPVPLIVQPEMEAELAYETPPDPPPITVPSVVEGRASDFITVQAATNGKIVRWLALDNGLRLFPPDLLRDTTMAVVTSNLPGSYRLLAYTSVKDVPSEPKIVTVLIQGPTPVNPPEPVPPDPSPTPIDPPKPVPVDPVPQVKSLWIVTVDDWATRGADPDRSELLGDTAFWNTLTAEGHWKQLDIRSKAAMPFKTFLGKDAKGVYEPSIIIMDAEGQHKLLWKGRLPKDKEAVQKLVGQYQSK